MIGWIKKLFAPKDAPIEDRVPHPSEWPASTPREEARVLRIVEAIKKHKADFPGQNTDRLAALRAELERRITVGDQP